MASIERPAIDAIEKGLSLSESTAEDVCKLSSILIGYRQPSRIGEATEHLIGQSTGHILSAFAVVEWIRIIADLNLSLIDQQAAKFCPQAGSRYQRIRLSLGFGDLDGLIELGADRFNGDFTGVGRSSLQFKETSSYGFICPQPPGV